MAREVGQLISAMLPMPMRPRFEMIRMAGRIQFANSELSERWIFCVLKEKTVVIADLQRIAVPPVE